MGLKASIYSGGKRSYKCEMCGAPLPFGYKMKALKCRRCTEKIAKEVEEEFNRNIGNEMTEAIMNTENKTLIDSIQNAAKLLENKPNEES